MNKRVAMQWNVEIGDSCKSLLFSYIASKIIPLLTSPEPIPGNRIRGNRFFSNLGRGFPGIDSHFGNRDSLKAKF